jgi:hypothetical protein
MFSIDVDKVPLDMAWGRSMDGSARRNVPPVLLGLLGKFGS